ncbi:MAG: hypothetical protein LBL47_01305 [Lactobacillus sp.]|jgi:hypothetical protein|nr:hypothetical protein [Lactobacillus sp.]
MGKKCVWGIVVVCVLSAVIAAGFFCVREMQKTPEEKLCALAYSSIKKKGADYGLRPVSYETEPQCRIWIKNMSDTYYCAKMSLASAVDKHGAKVRIFSNPFKYNNTSNDCPYGNVLNIPKNEVIKVDFYTYNAEEIASVDVDLEAKDLALELQELEKAKKEVEEKKKRNSEENEKLKEELSKKLGRSATIGDVIRYKMMEFGEKLEEGMERLLDENIM